MTTNMPAHGLWLLGIINSAIFIFIFAFSFTKPKTGRGLAHADLGVTTSFSAGPFSIAPVFHVQWCNDDFVKISSIGHSSSVKAWGGVTFSWAIDLGGGSSE